MACKMGYGGYRMKNQLFWLLPLFFVFIACQNQPEDTINIEKSDYTLYTLGRLGGLDEDTEWQILLSCQKKLKSSGKNVAINDIWIEKYYGPYCPYDRWDEWISNQTYPNGIFGINWDKSFYDEWYAYEAENRTLFAVVLGYEGWDTEERTLIQHFSKRVLVKNGDSIFLWDDGQLSALKDRWDLPFSEDFFGIVNQQNGLELETYIRIQKDYYDEAMSMKVYWEPEQICLQYLGTYNGYIILITRIGSLTMNGELIVGDVHFSWRAGNDRIFAWKEGKLFELQDLYEQELITRDDLVAAAYELGGGIE
jgi:hypothetical protein